MAFRASVLGAMTLASVWIAPANARAADLSAVYRDVKPSVVYLVCAQSDGVSSGSGFIFASGDGASTVITANHVIAGASRIDVILDNDPKRRYPATVLKRDSARDLAEMSIPIGHRAFLKLQNQAEIVEGMSIAAVGYPRAAKKFEELLGDDLRPSVHAGIVSAIRLSGQVIQFDAETDHGDSGGPVVGAKSGLVVGIIRGSLSAPAFAATGFETLPGSNFAMSASSIAAFSRETAHTRSSLSADPASVAPGDTGVKTFNGRTPAGAMFSSARYRVGLARPHYDDPLADAASVPLVTRLGEHFKDANEIYVVPAAAGVAEASNAKLGAYCDDTRLNALIEPLVRLHTVKAPARSAARERNVKVSVELKVTDCSGEAFYSRVTTTPHGIALANRGQDPEVLARFDRMLDDLIRDFDRFKAAHAPAWTSLLTTGIALDPADERYHSLVGFTLNEHSRRYRIGTVYAGGPGAEAGVESGDTVIAIDAKPVTGLTPSAFHALLNAPAYSMSVLRPGGLTVLHVRPEKYAELAGTLTR